MSGRILLVEGIDDVGFFSRFCTLTDFPDIEISPRKPADLGKSGNGWTNVLKALRLQLGRLRESDSGLPLEATKRVSCLHMEMGFHQLAYGSCQII